MRFLNKKTNSLKLREFVYPQGKPRIHERIKMAVTQIFSSRRENAKFESQQAFEVVAETTPSVAQEVSDDLSHFLSKQEELDEFDPNILIPSPPRPSIFNTIPRNNWNEEVEKENTCNDNSTNSGSESGNNSIASNVTDDVDILNFPPNTPTPLLLEIKRAINRLSNTTCAYCATPSMIGAADAEPIDLVDYYQENNAMNSFNAHLLAFSARKTGGVDCSEAIASDLRRRFSVGKLETDASNKETKRRSFLSYR
ncbi:hypothetical protein HK100_001306 [Physocladia obscura]|uniref:Uncharacterized protein n=1 Tax=Physocladia obscura TaxID=109957 RepID=A0AAD5XG90_9FUNG|nr:hypothetical protein HK100_001306 [Physocladia obscura]